MSWDSLCELAKVSKLYVVNRLISSRPAIAARSKLRQHPRVQGALVHALSLGRHGKGYEESVRTAMFACIRPGDCVWDVGANIGLYSELFAAAVGPAGKVISFEPSPDCVAIIEEGRRSSSVGTAWEVIAGALSDEGGDAWLAVADGSTAPSNHLANRAGASLSQCGGTDQTPSLRQAILFPQSSRLILFTVGKEMLVFHDFDNLVEQASRLLSERGLTARLGDAAAQRAHRDHTYDLRVAAILEKLL